MHVSSNCCVRKYLISLQHKGAHMKKTLALSIVTAATLLMAGCAKHTYSIVTQDGRTIISEGKPKETSAGLVGFVDANGVKQQINRADVKEITQIR